MSVIGQEYPRLLAPKGDGEILIWPPAREILRQTWENHRRLRHDQQVRLLGEPLFHLRAWTRRWLGHRDDHRPIIATGHQTELYHPGVWVKNTVIDAAARRISAEAIHFAVDTDAPKHLLYHWPGGGEPISDDPHVATARWCGLVSAPSPDHVQRVRAAANDAAASWGYTPAWDVFFDKLAELSTHNIDLSSALVNAHHVCDRELGLRHQLLLSSSLWKIPPYLLFVHDICARCEKYVQTYNAALAEFRGAYGIVSPGRPMPDLALDEHWCEIPFWLDDLASGQRQRAEVIREQDRWILSAKGDAFAFDPAPRSGWAAAEALGRWLVGHRLRLAPRALTLTSFLRLLVVDQFVHGIGGGLYDQVTDRILATWHDIAPPAFSVATATLYFPLADKRERTCLECLHRQRRTIQHGALGKQKMDWVKRIAAAPRHGNERSLLFAEMHRQLREAADRSGELAEWDRQYQEAMRQHDEDGRVFNRELPYTLQSQQRLRNLIAQVDDAFQS